MFNVGIKLGFDMVVFRLLWLDFLVVWIWNLLCCNVLSGFIVWGYRLALQLVVLLKVGISGCGFWLWFDG